jgi:hypothetical protein
VIAKALLAVANDLFAEPPQIHKISILADKLPHNLSVAKSKVVVENTTP